MTKLNYESTPNTLVAHHVRVLCVYTSIMITEDGRWREKELRVELGLCVQVLVQGLGLGGLPEMSTLSMDDTCIDVITLFVNNFNEGH